MTGNQNPKKKLFKSVKNVSSWITFQHRWLRKSKNSNMKMKNLSVAISNVQRKRSEFGIMLRDMMSTDSMIKLLLKRKLQRTKMILRSVSMTNMTVKMIVHGHTATLSVCWTINTLPKKLKLDLSKGVCCLVYENKWVEMTMNLSIFSCPSFFSLKLINLFFLNFHRVSNAIYSSAMVFFICKEL